MIRVMGLPPFATQIGHYELSSLDGKKFEVLRVVAFEEVLTGHGPVMYTVLATEGDEEFDDE